MPIGESLLQSANQNSTGMPSRDGVLFFIPKHYHLSPQPIVLTNLNARIAVKRRRVSVIVIAWLLN